MPDSRTRLPARGTLLAAGAGLLSFSFLIGGLLCVKSARVAELDRHLEGLNRREQENRSRAVSTLSELEEIQDPALRFLSDEELDKALEAARSKRSAPKAETLSRESQIRLLKRQLGQPSELSDQIDALLPNRAAWFRGLRTWGALLLVTLGLSGACLFLGLLPRGGDPAPTAGTALRALAWFLPAVLVPALAGWAAAQLTEADEALALYSLSRYLDVSGLLGMTAAAFLPSRARRLLGPTIS